VSAPITHAMVLAAGLGTRMRPLTDTLPKPLVCVHGRPLLDHVLDRLGEAGVHTVVVNVHHFADQMIAHLAGRSWPRVIISDERDTLLDSGGGIRKALDALGPMPFFVVNADTIWIEGVRANLKRMAESFDARRMDGLLLLALAAASIGYDGRGDFRMDPLGRLQRRGEREVAPFVYAGAAIMRPDLFASRPLERFSLNRIFDEAIARERLFGQRLDGLWMHVGTPAAVQAAEHAIADSAA
jgi:N-acetyl-alpha-D-muramate 1-phosphate uridylyltransferase